MASFSEKNPPPFDRKVDDYTKWKKNFAIWQSITDVVNTKQGGLLVLGLDEDTRDEVMQVLTTENLKEGAKTVIDELDKIFEVDESLTAYEAFEEFNSYKRPSNVTIRDFCREFQIRLAKAQSTGTVLADHVLAYKVLKSAGLTPNEEQLVKATTSKLEYVEVVKQLKNLFSSETNDISRNISEVKMEKPVEFLHNETFCGRVYRNYHRSDRRNESGGRDGYSYDYQYYENGECSYSKFRDTSRDQRESSDKQPEQGLYPGQKTHEDEGGIEDYAKSLQLQFPQFKGKEVHKVDIDHKLVGSTHSECHDSAVFSSVSKSVCGMDWLLKHIETLTPDQKSNVVHAPGNCLFNFLHSSTIISAVQQVTIPGIIIDNHSYSVQLEVVSENIPLLLANTDIIKLQDTMRAQCNTSTDTDTDVEVANIEIEVLKVQSNITEETIYDDMLQINQSDLPDVVAKSNSYDTPKKRITTYKGRKISKHEKQSWRRRKKKTVTYMKKKECWKQERLSRRKTKRVRNVKKDSESWRRKKEKTVTYVKKKECWKLEKRSQRKTKRVRYVKQEKESWRRRKKKQGCTI